MSTTTPNASSSRIGTPIRAIASTIASRSSPPLPPPSQSYEPLVKALFRYRLRYTLSLSALVTSFFINAWTVWQLGGTVRTGFWGALYTPLSPPTLFMTFLTWAAVALPITVLRKVFLTARRSPASSPVSIIKISFAQNSTRVAAITYALSSICALLFHVFMAYTNEANYADPKLSLFVKSKKHPHYLNGRLLFLMTTQIFTALAFVLKGAMMDRFVYRWAVATSPKQNWTPLRVLMACAASIIFTTLSIASASVFTGLARFSLPVFFKVPLLSMLLRPFAAHFLKGSWTVTLPLYHAKLLFRAWFLSFSTFMIWETADDLFENVVAERASLSTITQDPNMTLVSGATSTNRIFQFFAYSELRELATEDSTGAAARRTALFGDQKSVPNLWSCLSRESLLLLGHDYQYHLRRGLPPPPPVATAQTKPIAARGSDIGTPTPLLRQRIFRSAKDSPGQAALDALGSDGPIAQALDAGADATHVPELFRSLEARALTSPVAKEAQKNAENVRGVGGAVQDGIMAIIGRASNHVPEPLKYTGRQLARWFTMERLSRNVEASLPFRELDVVVIDVLSYLVCSSLTEDRYGTVQRDIPKILEAMISYLTAIEEYQMEINAKYQPSPSTPSLEEQHQLDVFAMEVAKSHETLGYVANGLKEGIARIVRTFGDKLLAFKFPPRIAQKLQAFLDYS